MPLDDRESHTSLNSIGFVCMTLAFAYMLRIIPRTILLGNCNAIEVGKYVKVDIPESKLL